MTTFAMSVTGEPDQRGRRSFILRWTDPNRATCSSCGGVNENRRCRRCGRQETGSTGQAFFARPDLTAAELRAQGHVVLGVPGEAR